MNQELMEYCKKEIQELLNKGIIWKTDPLGVVLPFLCVCVEKQSCSTLCAKKKKKNTELERGTPRLLINYKPLKIHSNE